LLRLFGIGKSLLEGAGFWRIPHNFAGSVFREDVAFTVVLLWNLE
jgi:hypothetical protein